MSSQQQADVTETSDDAVVTGNDAQTRNQVLEALKMRIRELETQTRAVGDEKFKCLICMVSTHHCLYVGYQLHAQVLKRSSVQVDFVHVGCSIFEHHLPVFIIGICLFMRAQMINIWWSDQPVVLITY